MTRLVITVLLISLGLTQTAADSASPDPHLADTGDRLCWTTTRDAPSFCVPEITRAQIPPLLRGSAVP